MPRNSQGLYALPSGNPVIPGTLIESGWANNTMSDVGDALTNSLPRNGVAPMTGPLILQTDPPTQPRHATSKAYVDSMLTYATGLPIGTVVTYAGSVVLSGFLLCNGQAVSRTTYADLFGTIGTIYGAGDGSNTFNLPDLQNQFIRGKGGSRTLGSVQAGMVGPHGHAVTDPIHTHGVITAAHTHAASSPAHGHTVTDPGHAHQVGFGIEGGGGTYIPEATISPADYRVNSSSAATGISVGSTSATVNVTAATQSVSIAGSASGVTVATSTGTENVPSNIALDFWIKAVQDVPGPVALTGIDTSDHEMISVDVTLPNSPMLVINSNVPHGTVKLDSNGKVPLANSQSGIHTFLGLWDASTGNDPSEENPFVVYANGDTFLIGVGGTIDLFDPATELESPTLVEVGDSIVRVSGSAEQPDGWYFIVATGAGVISSDTPTFTGVLTTEQKINVTQPYGVLQVSGADVLRFGSDNSGQLAGFRNKLINGNFGIWQRGSALLSVADSAYTADRWKLRTAYTGGATNVSLVLLGPNQQLINKLGVGHTTANATGVSWYAIRQVVEKSIARQLFGSTGKVTLSFRYKSNKTGNHGISLDFSTAVGGFEGSGLTQSVTFVVNAANTWEYKKITFSMAATANGTNSEEGVGGLLTIGFAVAGVATFTSINVNDYFDIAGVQLEEGSIATPFEQRPIGLELSLCQRYYYTFVDLYANATTTYRLITHPVTMRTLPTVVPIVQTGTPPTTNRVTPNLVIFNTPADAADFGFSATAEL